MQDALLDITRPGPHTRIAHTYGRTTQCDGYYRPVCTAHHPHKAGGLHRQTDDAFKNIDNPSVSTSISIIQWYYSLSILGTFALLIGAASMLAALRLNLQSTGMG